MRRLMIVAAAGMAGALLPSVSLLAGTAPERPAQPPSPERSAWSSLSSTDFYAESLKAVVHDSAGLQHQRWAVILDVDGTVLDDNGTAIPGAANFLHAVRTGLHGRIVLVTDRPKGQCPVIEANLRKENLEYDTIVCAADKSPPLSAITIVAYLGTRPQELSALSPQLAGDPARFASKYSLPVDPMYGSWKEMLKR